MKSAEQTLKDAYARTTHWLAILDQIVDEVGRLNSAHPGEFTKLHDLVNALTRVKSGSDSSTYL
jgi:hypothetical protein